jgi:glycogen(starch) synthase
VSCPTVVSLHAPIRLPAAVLRRLLTEVEAVAAVSASMKQQFSPLLAARTGPVRVIHNGLAFPAEPPAPLRQPATALCLGRMVHEKGFDIALRALSQVPQLRLIVAGDGIALPALQQLAKELSIADRVEFRGWVHPQAVPDLLNEVSVVLMPSRWEEPFGLVALQAAQMGRPIIASRIGGLPEIIRHGETGLLVPHEDPSALAKALQTLSDESSVAAAMGSAARLHAADSFSIERCASQYQELYALAATTGGDR